MSHRGTRILADRFADRDGGLAAIIAQLAPVLDAGDALPPDDITIYDDTRHLSVCNMLAPLPEHGMSYPCVRLMTMSAEYAAGVATIESTGARTVRAQLTVAVQPLLREEDTDVAGGLGMDLVRACVGVLMLFNEPQSLSLRESGGVRLEVCTGFRSGQVDAPLGDLIVSPGALLVTYQTLETVPIPLSL